MDTVYRETSGGRFEYWLYSEGRRWFVKEEWALYEQRRGRVRIVEVS
jgi:hypothetical protein